MFPLVRAFAGKYGEEVRAVTPGLLGEDIVDTLHFVPAEKKSLFLDVVKLLKEEIAPVYEQQERLQAHTAGVFPSWSGIGSTIEMRAVIESDYKLGTDVQRYKPACVGMIPVASISLRVDQGNPERFYFQVSEEELKDLIKSLEATLKELQEFKEHISFK
jgi:hypothetical protein